jgi:general secretion pathway protein M
MMMNLSLREKQYLLGGGGVLLLLLLLFGLVVPLSETMSGMDSRFVHKQEQLEKARLLQAEVAEVKLQLAQLERKIDGKQDASLFALIENNSEQLGFRDNLVSMRPQSPSRREGFRVEAVDLRLEKIRFDQLVSLLKAFDSSDMLLNVRQLKVKKRFDDPTLVDVTLQVESVQREV